MPRYIKCRECNGTGDAERIGGYDRPCDACRGAGRLRAMTPERRLRVLANKVMP